MAKHKSQTKAILADYKKHGSDFHSRESRYRRKVFEAKKLVDEDKYKFQSNYCFKPSI